MTAPRKYEPDAALVLTKAVLRTGDRLSINQALLARVLGVHPSTVTRYLGGNSALRQNTAEWDAAAALIKGYRSLVGLLDGNDSHIVKWMTSHNSDFGCAPVELLQRGGGVYQLGGYLDAYRGRF